MKSPEQGEDILPLKGDIFPQKVDYDEDRPRGWAWFKYYRSPRNRLVIPKNANYMNEELLIKVFEGDKVDTSTKHIEIIKEETKTLYDDC